ncbi:AraC family transcriptional regulator [Streptomyces sp. MP131-18]|uniref:helix-turn-helix transcriptional regulator n=1 Tax=Streptomyces sp. MP131-18 TaxID=1857892 RepID=UPI00097BC2BB|nr:AraC family transcriptional regulator [Streptomyces sp. MP131-18]ONK12302.1 Bacillibactin transport regulator [Streptomyces sp. MP131-18]
MDPFDDLLRGVCTDGAVVDLTRLTPPDAPRLGAGDVMTLCVPLRGAGRLAGRELRLGETAIVRGPEPFDADGDMTLLVGRCRLRGEMQHRLLRVLPRMLVVPDDHDCAGMRDYVAAHLTRKGPGRQIVVDRLLDWLLVCTLRDWFDRPGAEPPGWYRALGDEVAGPALIALHRSPERSWTLAALAAEAGVSRTTLAKRFTEAVGEAPLAYLTGLRMTLAADLLAESPASTVAAVARRVGYADPFGFSAAFKRVRGLSPSEHRAAVLRGGAASGADRDGDADGIYSWNQTVLPEPGT